MMNDCGMHLLSSATSCRYLGTTHEIAWKRVLENLLSIEGTAFMGPVTRAILNVADMHAHPDFPNMNCKLG